MMLKSRLFWKFFSALAVMIAAFGLVLGWLLYYHSQAEKKQDIERGLQRAATMLVQLSYPILQGKYTAEESQQLIEKLGMSIGFRLTILGVQGGVIADSQGAPVEMNNHADRPEVIIALAEGVGKEERFSSTMGAWFLYVAKRVRTREGRDLGVVRASVALTAIHEQSLALSRLIALITLVAVVIAELIALVLARSWVVPVLNLTNTVEALASGQIQQRAEVCSKDEIGRLAESVNRLAAELELRLDTITRENLKLLAVLASMTEGLISVDENLQIVHMNEVAGRLLGVIPANCIGHSIRKVVNPGDVSDIVEKSISEQVHCSQFASFRVGLSAECVIQLHAAPLQLESRAFGGVVVLSDVTELRRLERVRQQFVANVSHELKTPITAIRGMIETILEDSEMDSEVRHRFLERSRLQTERLSVLVADLLTLARLESTEKTEAHVLIDIRESVRDVIKSLEPAAEYNQIKVIAEIDELPLWLYGDAEGIRQIASNLLLNAIQYTSEYGQVTICLREADGQALLTVGDTGIGIDQLHQDRIFERFYRVDKARSREVGGTGLGLSIVKHLCIAHGGSVGVESRFGEGSVFKVLLPLAEQA